MRDPLYFAKLRVLLAGWRWRHSRRRTTMRARLRALRRRGLNSASLFSPSASSPGRRSSRFAPGLVTRLFPRFPQHSVLSPQSFFMEPLEPRLLMAADLAGLVQAHTLADVSVPTNGESAVIRVSNVGDAKTSQVSRVEVYASLDTTFDTADVLLGAADAPKNINAGAFKDVPVTLAMPGTLEPATYHLLARVDATNVIAEGAAGEANNVSTGPQFEVAWQFGAVPGRAGNTTLTLLDADGTHVTFSLSGPGTGEVIPDGSRWDMTVTGTTSTSILTISTNAAGNGRVSMDDIHVFGPLGALVASTTDLTGTLAVDGPLAIPGPIPGGVLLGSVQGGTIAAPSMEAIAVNGSVTDATFLIGAQLGQDGKLGGTGADADTFGPGSIGTLVVGGAVSGTTIRVGQDPVDGIFDNGNDVLQGGTSSSIGAIFIGGALSADSRIIAGALPASAFINGGTVTNLGSLPQFSTETVAPTLTASLAEDTGSSSTDGLTNNPTITGSATDASGIGAFKAGFGGTATVDVLADLQPDGSFTFTPARLDAINGAPLTDGPHTLTLLATDTKGNSSQLLLSLTLDRTPPAAVTFDLAPGSDTEVVGDQRTTASTVTLDGATEPAALVELLTFGLQTLADGTGAFAFSNVALALGANVLTVRATDAAGNQRTETRTVTRVAAPVLDPIGSQLVDEGTALTFTATAVDADTPANGLMFSLAGTVPAGATIDPITGVFTWTPTEAQGPGLFTFDVVVTDDGSPALSDSESIQVTVNEVNLAPVVTAVANQAVDEGSLVTVTLTATDSDLPANSLTWSLITAPARAMINPTTGEFSWVPSEAEGPGIFTVTARATDNGTPTLFGETTFTVTVNEVNAAPVLTAIGNQTVDEGTLLTFTATATDGDLPANGLTFSLEGLVPVGATIDPQSGVFNWIPAEDQGPGVYAITIRIADDGAPALFDEEAFQITVNEVNAAPVLAPIAPQTVDEGQTLTFTASATDGDLPANGLTFSLANAPTGASINLVTGEFSWTPSESQGAGIYLFDVVVTDNGTPALNTSQTVTVTVAEVNEAPTINAIGNRTVDEGQTLTFTATASDSDLPANGLTFNLAGAVPAGAAIDPITGVFTWTPTEAQGPGLFTFDVVVTDDGSPALSDSESIQVTVSEVNQAPVVNAVANQAVDEGSLVTVTLTATDSDLPANSLTWSLITAPARAMINPTTGEFSWVPSEAEGPGIFTVTARATDNGMPTLFGETTFTVTVTEVNTAPVLAALADATVEDGQLLTFTAIATDADVPANALSFSLQGTVPAGVAIDPTTGVLTWTPMPAQVGSHQITVRVTDNGSPSLFDEHVMSVTVTASDHEGPSLTAALFHDTGASTSDAVTSDPTIVGSVTDLSGLASFTGGFGATATFNLLPDVQGNGAFTLDLQRLEAINGGSLSDGAHTLRLDAADGRGNLSTRSISFILDRIAPAAPSIDLPDSQDTGISQTDNITKRNQVSPLFTTEIGLVRVAVNGADVAAIQTATGGFSLGLPVQQDGSMTITATVEDLAGNVGQAGILLVTIDTQAPSSTFDLDPAFDTTPVGDQQTTFATVSLVGTTEPNSQIYLFDETPFQTIGTDFAFGLSGDGSTVIGRTGGSSAYRWTLDGGTVLLGDLPGGGIFSDAAGVSTDGSVVVGVSSSSSGTEAFRWTAAGGIVGLGDLGGGSFNSAARDVSGDGAVVVGAGVSSSGPEAFRWTPSGGMVGLGDLPGGSFGSNAYAVSDDGAVVVGEGVSALGTEAARWTATTGWVGLGDLPGGSFYSRALDVSSDGLVAVGESSSSSGNQAFRWTQSGGMIGLGDLPGGAFQSIALAASGDGSVVVGSSDTAAGSAAFVWDAAHGMRHLRDVLVNEFGLGTALAGVDLLNATGVSSDGRVLVGNGSSGAWRVVLPSALTADSAGAFRFDNTQLDIGGNPFTVRTIDVAGNASDTTRTITRIDNEAPVAPIAPAAGLVSWWTGDGSASDLIGTNHGTLVNGTTFAPGKVGQAFSFDGVDDVVTTIQEPTYSTGATFSAWIKTTDTLAGLIAGGGGATSEQGMGLFIEPGGVLAFIGMKGTPGSQNFGINGPVINDGAWHHIAGTWTGDTTANGATLYVDGVQVGTATAAAAVIQDTHSLQIGGHTALGYARFDGQLDEVQVSARALSAAEIQASFDAGAAGQSRPVMTTEDHSIPVTLVAADADHDPLTFSIVTPPSHGTLSAITPLPLAGLVSQWSAEGDASDTAGSNDGTLQNGVGIDAAGKVGQAFRFDGVDDFIEIGNQSSLNFSGDFTVSAWVQTSGLGNAVSDSYIVSKYSAGSAAGWGLALIGVGNVNQAAFLYGDGSGSATAHSGATITDNALHHLVGVREGNSAKLYLDGVLRQTVAGPSGSTANANSARIGHRDAAASFFNGLVDEVEIYNRALSAQEIEALVVAGNTTQLVAGSTLRGATVRYTPDPDFSGTDSFTFNAHDGVSESQTATVTITVTPVNDAPVLAPIGNQVVVEGQALTFTATAIDSDLPANGLTFSLAGTVPAGAVIDPNTGVFTWTPAEAQGSGLYTFDVVVTDDGAPTLSDSETIQVTVTEGMNAPFFGLGDLSGGNFSSEALGLSADGAVVVGGSESANGTEAFRWTAAGGMQGLGDLPGGAFSSLAFDVSADGTVVVGLSTTTDGPEAFRWTAAGGIQGLGELPGGFSDSRAFGVSADGTVVVGLSFSTLGGEAFRWTAAGGMQSLGDLAGGTVYSYAREVSADGAVVVGWSESANGTEAFRWTAAGGMQGLGDLAGGSFLSQAYGTSADGAVIVGQGLSANGYEAFRWTAAGGMQGLGDLPGGSFYSWALGASADGAVLVGESITANGREAFIWDGAHGMRNLHDVLVEYGLGAELAGWRLASADDISPDGNVIVGTGINPAGQPEAWRVELPDNLAPVLAPIGNQAATAGQTLTFTATATDFDIPADTLTYSLESGAGGAVPAGATIDPATGLFSWTPTVSQSGTHTFDVVVTDNGTPTLSDRETITVTVAVPTLAVTSTSFSTTATSFTINWTTNLPSTTNLYWGMTPTTNNFVAGDPDVFTTFHSVTVTGLTLNTNYSVRPYGVSADGQELLAGPYTVRTARS